MKKRLLGILLAGVACLGLASCAPKEEEKLDYVSLRINPEVEMLVNEKGEVVDAIAVNDDGEEVLDGTELEGLSLYDATLAFTTRSVELGFCDGQNGSSTVFVGMVEDENGNEYLSVDLNAKLFEYLNDNNINVKVARDEIRVNVGTDSMYGSAGCEVVINRLKALNPSLDENELKDMDYQELLAELKSTHESMKEHTKEERIAYRKSLKDLHDKYVKDIDLKVAIDTLIAKIECATISEEAKALITIQLQVLANSFDEENYNEYEAAVGVLVGNFISVNVNANSKVSK